MSEKYVKLSDIIDTLENEWGYEGMREDLEKLPTSDVVEQKWIDVNERLPERDGETVLCYVQNSSTDGVTCVVGCIQQRKHWFLQTCEIGIATFPNHYWKVTHWMPLPEPPEEGVNNG